MYKIRIPKLYAHNREMCEQIARGYIAGKTREGEFVVVPKTGCLHLWMLGLMLSAEK